MYPIVSVIKQTIDPKALKDESISQFLARLSLCSVRVPEHPAELIATRRLLATLRYMPEFSSLFIPTTTAR